jgi:hypothetical protein
MRVDANVAPEAMHLIPAGMSPDQIERYADEYRRTINRNAWRMRIGFGLLLGVFTTPVGYALTHFVGIDGPSRVPLSFVLGLTAAGAFIMMVRSAHRAVEQVTIASLPLNRRDSAPPIRLSLVQSLVARGAMEEAGAMYDALLVEHGYDDVLARDAVAFHTHGGGDPRRAESILRGMRAAEPARHEYFATQRLIDLYLGPLAEPQRALTELRRLADRFPGTREADGALLAIAEIRQGTAR